MSRSIGWGRYRTETYPQSPGVGGGGAGSLFESGTLSVTINDDSSYGTATNPDEFVTWSGNIADTSYAGTPLFELDDGGGALLNYVGDEARDIVVMLVVSVHPDAGTPDLLIAAGIAKNDDLVGDAILGSSQSAAGVSANSIGGVTGTNSTEYVTTTSMRRMTMNPENTIRPVMAKQVGDVNLNISNLHMTIWVLP